VEELLQFIFETLLDCLCYDWWRLSLCLTAAAAIVSLIQWLLHAGALRDVLDILAWITGAVLGAVWEVKAR
jgi:hypothetical protein